MSTAYKRGFSSDMRRVSVPRIPRDQNHEITAATKETKETATVSGESEAITSVATIFWEFAETPAAVMFHNVWISSMADITRGRERERVANIRQHAMSTQGRLLSPTQETFLVNDQEWGFYSSCRQFLHMRTKSFSSASITPLISYHLPNGESVTSSLAQILSELWGDSK